MTNPRRYAEDRATSRELLRRAVPLMSEHQASLTPITFSVWYEFCAGHNGPLLDAMYRSLADGAINDEVVAHLFCEYIAGPETHAAHKLSEGLTRVMAEMVESARQAGTKTEKFEHTLQRWDAALREEALPDEALVAEMTESTREIRGAMRSLREQLDTSRREAEELRQSAQASQAAAQQAEQKVQTLETVVESVQAEASRDPLTGLANRRVLEQDIQQCLDNPTEQAVLVFCDIDHFKSVNDKHGHALGDDVLRKVANVIASFASSPNDTASRYGGEEFVVLMRNCTLQDGYRMAETIRACIARAVILRRRTQEAIGRITASFGVAARNPVHETADSWLERADKALYASKQGGRNRVSVAD